MSMSYSTVIDPKTGRTYEVDDLGRERPISISDLDMKEMAQPKVPAQFPRMVFQPKGDGWSEKVVPDAKALQSALSAGWMLAPDQGDGGCLVPHVNSAVIDFDENQPRKPGRPKSM